MNPEQEAAELARKLLRCSRVGPCAGTAKLVARFRTKSGRLRSKAIGHASFTMKAGKSKKVRVPLTRKGSAMLRAAARHRMKVKFTGRGTKPRTILLKQVRPSH